jgi:hypothetical protein
LVPPIITVGNRIPARIFPLGTLYLTVISRENRGNHIFLDLVYRKMLPANNVH